MWTLDFDEMVHKSMTSLAENTNEIYTEVCAKAKLGDDQILTIPVLREKEPGMIPQI